MNETLTPIYEQDPTRLEALHDRLSAAHGSLPGLGDEPVRHTAHVNHEWTITLGTSEGGELQSASMLRAGTIPYDFARTETGAGEKKWAAVDAGYRFPEAHFSNLVTLATLSGLEWIRSPEAGPR